MATETKTAVYAFVSDGVIQSIAVLEKDEVPEGFILLPKGKEVGDTV